MFCGTFVSFLVPETKGLSLEVLAGEQAPHARHGTSSGGVLSALGLHVHRRGKNESGKHRIMSEGRHGWG